MMKKLNLNDCNYTYKTMFFKDDIVVKYVFPDFLTDNQILKNNIEEHTSQMFVDFFNYTDKLEKKKEELENCIFECEQMNLIKEKNEIEDKINYIKANINEDLFPYFWIVYKDFNSFFPKLNEIIKADYLLVFSQNDLWIKYMNE